MSLISSVDTQIRSTDNPKTSILGLSSQPLAQWLKGIGEKPFRAKQLLQWIHQRGVIDFHQMTDLSQSLRQRLSELASINLPQVKYHHISSDGTQKWVLSLESGSSVEMVFIPESTRGTLCISSQVGCALDCQFCSTGKQGFQRDLTSHEIIAQVWLAKHFLAEQGQENPDIPKGEGYIQTVTNVVLMGMGEPLLNLEAVIPALELMLDDHAYGLSKRRVTVSTSGLVPQMKRLFEAVDVALAVSLHAPTDELRDVLMPINRKYPLSDLMQACHDYLAQGPNRRTVTMEYVLLKGVNDRPQDAKALIRLLSGMAAKVNLIPFNPFPGAPFARPELEATLEFQQRLLKSGVFTTIRKTRGDSIDAACGQLVGQVQDRTRRAETWKNQLAQEDKQDKQQDKNFKKRIPITEINTWTSKKQDKS
jgi:23S rRNA (adenine2503-C2)-methyltransferase